MSAVDQALELVRNLAERFAVNLTPLDEAQLALRLSRELDRGNELTNLDIANGFRRLSSEIRASLQEDPSVAHGLVAHIDEARDESPELFSYQADDAGYNLLVAGDNLTYQNPTQALDGADGVPDVFVFYYDSDPNGGFASFGGVTINDYSFSDGDRILLIDRLNQWGSDNGLEQMAAAPDNRVTGLEGDINLAFNSLLLEDDSGDDILLDSVDAYINILGEGVKRDSAFGFTVENLEGVILDFATADEISLAGSLADYVENLW